MAAFTTGNVKDVLFHPEGNANAIFMRYMRNDGEEATSELGKLVTQDLIAPQVGGGSEWMCCLKLVALHHSHHSCHSILDDLSCPSQDHSAAK
jgi:hypothetical protein